MEIQKRRLAILGSTGSIGTQALDVVRQHPDLFQGGAAFDYTGSWTISPYIGARLTVDIIRMK